MKETITSLQNPTIKNLVKLRQRRQRDKQTLMLIDGVRALMLALQNDASVQTIFFETEQASKQPDLLKLAEKQRITLQPVSAPVFQKIGYGDNPDGWLGLAPQPTCHLADLPTGSNPWYMIVEGLEKPGNLGAILRSADAAGVSGLIVCDSQTDLYNPNIIRTSRGAFFTVPLAQTTTIEAIAWLQTHHIQILAATPTATQPYIQADMTDPIALVVGAEHQGLRLPWLQQTSVYIPMVGQVDSLNVAQSATILMFEAVRQRSKMAGSQSRKA